nr:MAG TPA: protein of unknown function (DUF4972) [Caudoviricetes sp.]
MSHTMTKRLFVKIALFLLAVISFWVTAFDFKE